MTRDEFIHRFMPAIAVRWSCVLYYRHVIGIEIHHKARYESGCRYQWEVAFWQRTDYPVDDGVFIGYLGSQPAHIGLIIDGQAFHSRGENGGVRLDRLIVIEKK